MYTANAWIDEVHKLGGPQMPRIARIKVRGEETVYHVMSRTALDGFVMGDVEKDSGTI